MHASGARRWIAAAGIGLLAGSASAQIEGPLDNDAFLPVSAPAEEELARGDQAFLAARAGDAGAWTAACEAWRNALRRSRSGESASPRPRAKPDDASPWEGEGALDRHTEGVEAAVLRRLAALSPEGRAVWAQRFAQLSLEELGSAGASPAALSALERELPATPGAARAALLLSEIAFESADAGAARAWLARAGRHARALTAGAEELRGAIERREAALPAVPELSEEAWRTASELEHVATHPLETPRGSVPRVRALGSGPQAGLAFLGGERALLQTPGALWLLEGATLHGPFGHDTWLGPSGFSAAPAVAPGDGPGWRLDPAVEHGSAVVVAGRSLADRPNLLARVEPGLDGAPPTLAWALEAGPAAQGGEPSDAFEFQPGPLWRDGRIFVLVRRSDAGGERELELRALDAASGAWSWSTYLGKGGERIRDPGRFARRGVPSLPAEPLAWTAGGIFAAAPVGFGALVESLDGRVRFTLRPRRRPLEARGWTGWGVPAAEDGMSLGWAPADSDHLYVLDVSGRPDAASPLLASPEPRGEAAALVTADPERCLVLSQAGARWALATWDLASGARQDALRLGPEEVFAGRALAGGARVLAASDRALYLFDRDRDLALLAAPALRGPVPRGGSVWARGSRVYVLSNRCLEIFDAR